MLYEFRSVVLRRIVPCRTFPTCIARLVLFHTSVAVQLSFSTMACPSEMQPGQMGHVLDRVTGSGLQTGYAQVTR